jgi:hypothetical protein
MKKIFLVLIILLFDLVIILACDFFWGRGLVPQKMDESHKPYAQKDNGWYELKPSFDGHDQYGSLKYKVKTDPFGFRINENTDNQNPGELRASVIFLGDSFTYGINGPWNDIFVGQYAKNTKKQVINAGVSSYSPTAYLYQYKKALNLDLLSKGHSVVIGVDISDVQDEAAYWTDGPSHPVKQIWRNSLNSDKNSKPINSGSSATRYLVKFKEFFPVTTLSLQYLRALFSGPSYDQIVLAQSSYTRSGFTHMDWNDLNKTSPFEGDGGYKPLGVEAGLSRLDRKIEEINKLAKVENARVYLLIYPWPAQIMYKDKYSWGLHIEKLCKKIKCSGVIDLIDELRQEANFRKKNWYSDWYVYGDIHFNSAGNEIIAKKLSQMVD